MSAAIDTALQLLHASRFAEAEAAFRRVLAGRPGDIDALHGLSVVAFERGDKAGAETLLREVLQRQPDRFIARYDLACMYIEQGRDAEAEPMLRKVLELEPAHASAWYQLGFVRKMQDDFAGAERAFQECLRLKPAHEAATNDAARLLRERGDYAAALSVFERAALLGGEAGLYHLWDQFASVSALPTIGQRILQRGVELFPKDAELRIGLAQALEGSGDKTAAEQQYRFAIGLDAGRGLALGSLLSLIGSAAEPALVEHVQRIIADPQARDAAKAVIGYGLGKVHQERGDYAAAFEAWTLANAARRSEAGALERAALSAQIEEARAAFSADNLRALAPHGSTDERPVFIVGMPRSGTTLVEQIIASHLQAEGLGELPDIPIVAENFCRAFGSKAHWPASAKILVSDKKAIAGCAAHYLRVLQYRMSGAARRVVDKSPLNFFNLALIALLFPKAKIIWCRRDPRDVCLSIFSENFAPNQKYATDLADLGFYYREHERLMRHWQRVLPTPIHEVVYEALVDDQERETRRLIDFVGLPWDAACLQFHNSTRAVTTPSRWQVRKPMYKTSLQRWRHYEPWLQPLFAELDGRSAGADLTT